MIELPDLTLAQAARMVRDRKLSPVELVEAALARIKAHDGVLKSFITVFEEQALQVAKAAEMLSHYATLFPIVKIVSTVRNVGRP
ncbi:MAG: hypothetical protein NVS2B4_14610 [Ramlibacter sp.]